MLFSVILMCHSSNAPMSWLCSIASLSSEAFTRNFHINSSDTKTLANFRVNNCHLSAFLTVGECHIFNNASLCFQTLQDLESNNKKESGWASSLKVKRVFPPCRWTCLCSEHAHFSGDDERAVQVCLKMKEMSVFLSRFISLNSGVFYPLYLSVLTHRDSEPHLAVRSQSPWLSGVFFTQTSTNRITMMLKGLWWVNWDKSAALRRGCCGVAPRTKSFPCRKSSCSTSRDLRDKWMLWKMPLPTRTQIN